MSKEYSKKCSNCGSEIIMSQMESGKWSPLETDGSTAHRCMTGSTDKKTQNGKPSSSIDDRLSYVESELKKLKEWLAVQPLK